MRFNLCSKLDHHGMSPICHCNNFGVWSLVIGTPGHVLYHFPVIFFQFRKNEYYPAPDEQPGQSDPGQRWTEECFTLTVCISYLYILYIYIHIYIRRGWQEAPRERNPPPRLMNQFLYPDGAKQISPKCSKTYPTHPENFMLISWYDFVIVTFLKPPPSQSPQHPHTHTPTPPSTTRPKFLSYVFCVKLVSGRQTNKDGSTIFAVGRGKNHLKCLTFMEMLSQ